MPTYYTIIGAFQPFRNRMNKEFKRVGISDIKEKRWFFHQLFGYPYNIKEMSLSQLEATIHELQKLDDNHYILIREKNKGENQ